jgi:beta-mannosidase
MKIENTELKIWQWKERDTSLGSVVHEAGSTAEGGVDTGWQDALAYPSEIHVELLSKGEIPDPFLGFNEHKVQCKSQSESITSSVAYHRTPH